MQAMETAAFFFSSFLARQMLLLLLLLLAVVPFSQELPSSQTQSLLRIQRLLEYPRALENLTQFSDLCRVSATPFVFVGCSNGTVTELHIVGDKPTPKNNNKVSGFCVSKATLSEAFSADSFFTTLSKLRSLRSLTLVSLGIWGTLSTKLNRLCSLERLNISRNYVYGDIPFQLSRLRTLRGFVMEDNLLGGQVPDWFSTMPNLEILSLRGNRLSASLPPTFSSLQALKVLVLSDNQLSGELPDLSSLMNLQVLDIRSNRLGPDFPALGKQLIKIYMGNNRFKSEVPRYLKALNNLQYLDMSANGFSGLFPAFLISSPNIRKLNVSSNFLTGTLPINLSCGAHLEFVDVSQNLLQGNLPSCLMESKVRKIIVKFSGNCLSLPEQQHSSHCQPIYVSDAGKTRRKRCVLVGLAAGFVGGLTLLVVLLVLLLLNRYRRKMKLIRNQPRGHLGGSISTGISSKLLINARYISKAIKLGTQGLPQYRSFAREEVEEATNNFHESNFIGEGSYGKMYRGTMGDGTLVAVRCLRLNWHPTVQNLKLHFEVFAKLRHLNLVTLLGHCIDVGPNGSTVKKIFLIYEYISNGTLEQHLADSEVREPLNWLQRLKIASGLAKAVHFLHTGIVPGIDNNNLKISNVLIDQGCIAKLSDYGLPGLTVNEAVGEKRAHGSELKATTTSKTAMYSEDIYRFGLILLQIIVGKSPSLSNEAVQSMVNLIMEETTRWSTVDQEIKHSCVEESLKIVIDLTARCLAPNLDSRPSFEDILWNLQYASQLQDACTSDVEEQ